MDRNRIYIYIYIYRHTQSREEGGYGLMITLVGNGLDNHSSILDETVCISYSTCIKKVMNLVILSPVMGK